MCTRLPPTVQFPLALKPTDRPELAVALTVKSASPNVLFASAPKVMVWFCFTGPFASGHTYAPRLRVHTDSAELPRSMTRLQTITCGIPLSKRNHFGEAAVMSFV